ncbi:MAG: hypothetical protein JNK76_24615 [Planctomycetales bacterium]|nr:hypothetical protein [Planctomycetales bacterium]MBN8629162.1 hypothetical protein [Planctomycetota bacterium]
MSVERIYAQLVAAGASLKLPAPWQALRVDPAFFQLAVPPEVLQEDLRTKFDLPSLIESGVFLPAKDGTAIPNPQVFSPGAVLWAVRTAPKAAPFDIIADQRNLRPAASSLTSILRAHQTQTRIQDAADRVVVVFSMIDLAILRGLEIAAVPAVALRGLQGQSFDSLLRLLHRETRAAQALATSPGGGRTSAKSYGSRSLVLHDWSLERLDADGTAQGRELWSYLGKLEQCFRLNLGDCEYIRPTADELAQLRFILEHRRWKELRDAIIDTPYAEARSLYCESLRQHAPPSLAAALERWYDGLRHGRDAGGRRAAWQDLLAAQEREILQPLAAEAQRSEDSAERNLLTALEGMSRLLHPQTLLLAEKFAGGGAGTAALAVSHQEEFRQLFATADRVMALSNGVRACRRHRRPPRTDRPQPKPPSTSSNRSASAPSTSQP